MSSWISLPPAAALTRPLSSAALLAFQLSKAMSPNALPSVSFVLDVGRALTNGLQVMNLTEDQLRQEKKSVMQAMVAAGACITPTLAVSLLENQGVCIYAKFPDGNVATSAYASLRLKWKRRFAIHFVEAIHLGSNDGLPDTSSDHGWCCTSDRACTVLMTWIRRCDPTPA